MQTSHPWAACMQSRVHQCREHLKPLSTCGHTCRHSQPPAASEAAQAGHAEAAAPMHMLSRNRIPEDATLNRSVGGHRAPCLPMFHHLCLAGTPGRSSSSCHTVPTRANACEGTNRMKGRQLDTVRAAALLGVRRSSRWRTARTGGCRRERCLTTPQSVANHAAIRPDRSRTHACTPICFPICHS